MAVSKLKKFIKQDLAMDLGTANTLIYLQGEGVVLNEPTVIALDQDDRVLQVGGPAKTYLGRTPHGLKALRPLKDGVIEDFKAASLLIQAFISKAKERKGILSPRVAICVPSNITQVEKRAVYEAARTAGAKKIYLLEETMAAAIGAGLPIHDDRPKMVLDIGGGTTEIAVISKAAYMVSEAIRVSGDEMDQAVTRWFLQNLGQQIGPNTAEKVKWKIGAVLPKPEYQDLSMEVYGKDLPAGGMPKGHKINAHDLCPAFEEPVRAIVDLVDHTLKGLSHEVLLAIKEDGITVTGGASLLRALPEFLHQHTGVEFHLTEDPLTTVVKGAGKTIEEFKKYRDVFLN